MSAWFPVCLNLAGRKCLVVGGGKVALRKTLALLDFGSTVVVLAPAVVEELKDLALTGRIEWIADEYREGYLQGCFIAVAATGRRETNRSIARDCRKRGLLVNVVDDPQLGDFNFSAYLKRGDFLLSASTGGHSPALAARVIDQLAEEYGPGYADFVELLGEARVKAQERIADPETRRRVMQRMAGSDALQLLQEGKKEEARKRVMECLSLSSD